MNLRSLKPPTQHLITVLILAGVMISTLPLEAQIREIDFERVNIEDGLSQNSVKKIAQDKAGFLWIATEDGLNRYNGYDFIVFANHPDNLNSLSHNIIEDILFDNDGETLFISNLEGIDIFNTINYSFQHLGIDDTEYFSLPDNTTTCIMYDDQNRLWVGTIEGLTIFDSASKTSITYKNNPNDPLSLSHNYIYAIHQSPDGSIWVGTMNGLNKVRLVEDNTLKVERIYLQPPGDQALLSNEVISLYGDNRDQLWIGTENGLNILNKKKGSITRIENIPGDKHSISDNRVTVVSIDSKGNTWVGTKNGLNLLKKEHSNSFMFDRYFNDEANPFSISNNWISSLFEDNTGVLWIGSYFGGLNKIRLYGNRFEIIRHNSLDSNSISSNVIRSIVKDSKKDALWIGTNPGLNKVDLKSGKITRYYQKPNNSNWLNNDIIRSLCIDNSGKLWIGTGRGGINVLDPDTGVFKHYVEDPNNINSIKGRDVRTLFEDSQGDIWAGTNDAGLNRINPKTGKITTYSPDTTDEFSIGSKYAYHIAEDNDHNLWIGTYDGLEKFERSTGKFYHFRYNVDDSTSLSNNYVKSVMIDHSGNLWVSTAGGGINKMVDRNKGIFKRYTTSDGLPNNFVYGMLEDNQNNIWASTNKGISKFDPQTGVIRNYEKSDGLQGNEFNSGAFYKADNGEMYFGGIKGLTYFLPENIKDNPFHPNVVITDIQIFNKSVFTSGNDEMKELVNCLATDSVLCLSYKQNVISFEFSSLHYSNPAKNSYAYKMEGFDQDWLYADADKRFATYTNLPPGEYVLKLKGSNSDGVWNDNPTELNIYIVPPFYRRGWFIISVIICVLLLAYAIHMYRLRNIRTQKILLEKVVRQRTLEINEQNKELAQQKSDILLQKEELETQKEALESSYESVRVLSIVGHEIASVLDFNSIIDKVYKHVNELMDVFEFGIGIYDDRLREIDFSLYIRDGNKMTVDNSSIDKEKLSSWCIKNKKSIWINDINEEHSNYLNHFDHYKEEELLTSIICIPMFNNERLIGIVSAQSKNKNAYTQYHFDILNALTSYITVAIENANAYKSLEDKISERTKDLKNAYEELLITNTNFDKFAYRSAHDLRGPLARILGLCNLGRIETNDEKGIEYLNLLEKVAFEMDQMLSRLLRTHDNKKKSINNEDVIVNEVVHEIIENLGKTFELKNIELRIKISKNASIKTDKLLFKTLIENVIANAVQFQDASKKEHFIDISADVENKSKHLKINIKENGIGIGDNYQKHIFDMFYVASDLTKGSGLGLYEAMVIAQKLKGKIKLSGSSTAGSEFEIIL